MTVIYKTLDDPLGKDGTQAFSINDLGQVVGEYYSGASSPRPASFIA